MNATRQDVIDLLERTTLDFDDFDVEDVGEVIDVLLEGFTALEVMTWLYLPDAELGTTPVAIIRDGGVRRVMQKARKMIAERP